MRMIPAVSYQKINDDGLHVVLNGEQVIFNVNDAVICAGQKPHRKLVDPLYMIGKTVHLISGCDMVVELGAQHAIAQGTRLALEI